MLVLTRRIGERIILNGGEIVVTVVGVERDKVRIGVTAPRDVTIHREEVQRDIDNGVEQRTYKTETGNWQKIIDQRTQ